MTVRDLAINLNTGEFIIVNGDLSLASDAAAIAQAIDIRLKMFLGEWFLDQTVGMPWFQKILGKRANAQTLLGLFSNEIQNTIGVNAVTSINIVGPTPQRQLTVNWVADTDFGQLTGATVLNAGKA